MTDPKPWHARRALEHLEAAGDAAFDFERDALLDAAVMRMSPEFAQALSDALARARDDWRGPFEWLRKEAAFVIENFHGRVYRVDPPIDQGNGVCCDCVRVAQQGGDTVIAACIPDGDRPAFFPFERRLPGVVADDVALSVLGYRLVEGGRG